MQLRPLSEILAASKEKLDEIRAPIRAKAAKAKAAMYEAKLENELADLENKLNDLATSKELDFEKMADAIDEMEIKEHRLARIQEITDQLFPVTETK